MAHQAVIDSAEHGPGFVVVSGWLATPRELPWPDPVLLRIGAALHPVSRWFVRADLPAAAEAPLFLAFSEDLPRQEEDPAPRIRLELPDGTILADLAPEQHRAFRPHGHLEHLSGHGLGGWVYDPALWHGEQACALFLDGEFLHALRPSQPRPDLPYSAAQRGLPLGLLIDAAQFGRLLGGRRPFDGQVHRWSLHSSGVEIAAIEGETLSHAHGRLEAYAEGQVRGWAAYHGRPDLVADVELSVNGVRYASVSAARRRSDLVKHRISDVGGAYAFPLRASPDGSGTAVLDVRVLGEASPLQGGPLTVEGLRPPAPFRAAPWRALEAGRPRVSIVIPVFNAAEDLALCLAAVCARTGGLARLIIVDDASTDPRVQAVLAPYRGRAGIEILANERNLGFTRTCNRGMEAAGRDDVVLLNSDTIVPARWLENLVLAARATPRTGSATPLSDNAGAFSAPELGSGNRLPPGLAVSDLARLAAQASLATFPEVPTGHGFCLYLRREMLDAVGLLDAEAFPRGYGEENDLCMRALRAGFRHVIDDRTYVRHRQSASFGAAKAELLAAGRAVLDERYPEYTSLVRPLAQDETFLAMRWRIRRAFQGGQAPRPRVLFVISTETGGTPQTNLDLMRALEDRYEPWLLRCDRQTLTLQRLEGGALQPVERQDLDRPIAFALHAGEDYDELVAAMLLRHAIELVHIRHLAWHGFGLPAVARRMGIPVVLSLHDFYLACPTIKLLDDEMRHCGGRCTAGEGLCRAELWPPGEVPALKHRFVHRWREMVAPALAACDAFVTTAPSARAIMQETFPLLRERDFRVIAHGRSFTDFTRDARAPEPGEVLRVLVPGNISLAKGALLVQAMADLDQGRQVEFHVLGDHGVLQAGPGLVLHGRYTRDDFARRVAEIRPHLGAVLSIWPETYCHTLTELWSCGLPVFALDFGAVGERLRAHGGGWLHAAPQAEPLLEALHALKADAEGFRQRLDDVAIWQRGEGLSRDVAAMSVDYDQLYRDLAARRLAFAPPPGPLPVWLRVAPGGAAPWPGALRNAADAPLIFRDAPPEALAAALEAGGLDGVLLWSAEGEAALPGEAAAACAGAGLPLVLLGAEALPPETIGRLFGPCGGGIARHGPAEGLPGALREIDLGAPAEAIRAALLAL